MLSCCWMFSTWRGITWYHSWYQVYLVHTSTGHLTNLHHSALWMKKDFYWHSHRSTRTETVRLRSTIPWSSILGHWNVPWSRKVCCVGQDGGYIILNEMSVQNGQTKTTTKEKAGRTTKSPQNRRHPKLSLESPVHNIELCGRRKTYWHSHRSTGTKAVPL